MIRLLIFVTAVSAASAAGSYLITSPCSVQVKAKAWSGNSSFAFLDDGDIDANNSQAAIPIGNIPIHPLTLAQGASAPFGRVTFANFVTGGDVSVVTVAGEQYIQLGFGVYELEGQLRGGAPQLSTTNARAVTYQWREDIITNSPNPQPIGTVGGTYEIISTTAVSGFSPIAKAIVCGPKFVRLEARFGYKATNQAGQANYEGLTTNCWAKVQKIENWGTDTNQSVQYKLQEITSNSPLVNNGYLDFRLDATHSPVPDAYDLSVANDEFTFASEGYYRISFNATFYLNECQEVSVEPIWNGVALQHFWGSTGTAPGAESCATAEGVRGSANATFTIHVTRDKNNANPDALKLRTVLNNPSNVGVPRIMECYLNVRFLGTEEN